MRKLSALIRGAVIACAVVISVGGAQAHTIQVYLQDDSPTKVGSSWEYNYKVYLTGNNYVLPTGFVVKNGANTVGNANDGFTILDFAGLTGLNVTAANSAVSVNDFQAVASNNDPKSYLSRGGALSSNGVSDDTSVPDITFQYTGNKTLGNTSPTYLFSFTATSTVGSNGLGEIIGYQDHNSPDSAVYTSLDKGNDYVLPVPEPAFYQLGALLVLGAGFLYFRRRRTVSPRSFAFAAA